MRARRDLAIQRWISGSKANSFLIRLLPQRLHPSGHLLYDEGMAEGRIGEYELVASLQAVDVMQRFRARRVGDLKEVELRVSSDDYLTADEWPEVAAQWQKFLRFHHPHVQLVLDFGISEQRPFVVYQWLAASPLRSLLQAQRQQGRLLTGEAAAALLLPVCAGLAELQRKLGFVHGRLGPDAVWVWPSGVGVLAGVAEVRLQRRWESVTGRGVIRPSLHYLAPEQARGLPLAPPADVFALGTLLYELVSGQSPLGVQTELEALQQLLLPTPVPPIATQVQELDTAIAEVIDRALQKDCAHRYPSVGELAQALAAVAGSAVPTGLTPSPVPDAESPRAPLRETAIAGLRIDACAVKWEDLAPHAPIDGHPARHCARCDQAVVQAAGADALGQALQGRCLHLTASPAAPGGFWKRLLRR